MYCVVGMYDVNKYYCMYFLLALIQLLCSLVECVVFHCLSFRHDDVIKWKHLTRYWPFVREIHWSPMNSPHKGQWRGALMFSLICAWIIGRVNNRVPGDLRCHRANYDVTVVSYGICLAEQCPEARIKVGNSWSISHDEFTSGSTSGLTSGNGQVTKTQLASPACKFLHEVWQYQWSNVTSL